MDFVLFYNLLLPFFDERVLLGIGTGLFIASEILSYIPAIKANGVFQAIYNGIRKAFVK